MGEKLAWLETSYIGRQQFANMLSDVNTSQLEFPNLSGSYKGAFTALCT